MIFPKDAGKLVLSPHLFSLLMPLVCLTSYDQRVYFVRSTCLLRTINVLTSYVQRAYFVQSETNSSDFMAKHIGSLCENHLISWLIHAGKHVFLSDKFSFLSDEFVLLRPFNVFTSADQRAYFGRSTCLLRPK